jgi:hypothetical protein
MLAGIPFGCGYVLIFLALLNYLADAYEIFAASAMAVSTCSRSIAGAVLRQGSTFCTYLRESKQKELADLVNKRIQRDPLEKVAKEDSG